ncbi:MAG: hypothetical protein IPJ69_09985 [Deltaproteobacteria bacterium]|nr:MAG: hypothetical protein IPJ69_09985 [Deltaproteobacteria bacterium]
MKRFLLISFFALFSFLPPTISEAKNACTLNDTIILIKPFTSKKSSPRSLILPLLIKDYLNLSSKISARFQEDQKQPTLILKGTLTPKGTDYAFQSQIENFRVKLYFVMKAY